MVGRGPGVERHQVAERRDAFCFKTGEVSPGAHNDAEIPDRRVVFKTFDKPLELGDVDTIGHQPCSPKVEPSEPCPVEDTVPAVDRPFPPAHARQQADITRASLQSRPAVVPPRACVTLCYAHRYREQFSPRVVLVGLCGCDDPQSKVEFDVVPLHAGLHDWPTAASRVPPQRFIEVEPDDSSLGSEDPTPTASFGGEPYRLQDALVVRELQQIVEPTSSREQLIAHRILKRWAVERGCQDGDTGAGRGYRLKHKMVLDVNGAVSATAGDNKHVRTANASTCGVDRKGRPKQHAHVFDGDSRQLFTGFVDHTGGYAEALKLGDSALLKGDALIEAPLDLRSNRSRGHRAEDVVLRPHGASSGDIAALWRHPGQI